MLPLHPEARACGKVILLGEHAVVYGVPALAAGLPDALRLRARPHGDPRAPIALRIPHWGLDVTLSPDDDHPVARACTEVLAWCDGPLTGWCIDGDTDLPARAGLGSSAALTTACARLALGPRADLDLVVQASLAGERVFHGEPSGIDSELAARGGLLRYVRGEGVEPIEMRGSLPLVIVPSGVPRSTADQVAKVRARYDRSTILMRSILEAFGHAVTESIQAVETGALDDLGEQMDIAHGLLGAMGVSSPILDELCSIARSGGARGAKLTGAGGGGCIIAVPPPDPTALLEAFRARDLNPLLVDLSA